MATINVINIQSAGVVTYNAAGAFTASALTQNSTLFGGASNLITSLGVATNGQLAIGSTGVSPVLGTLTPGTGISITNAAGAITVNAIGGGVSWTDVTLATQAMAINSGYTANRGTLITFTLPVNAVYGSVFEVVGKDVGLWLIAQNANQMIHFGSVTSTTGVGGSVASILQYDTIKLVCTVANLEFTVLDGVGNLTVV